MLRRKRAKLKFGACKAEQPSGSEHADEPNWSDESNGRFLEIFAGEAGLTLEIKRVGISVDDPGDVREGGRVVDGFDLLDTASFKKLKSKIKRKRYRWIHFAPPCKTFSRARRRDRFAKARALRSRQKPQGFDPKPQVVSEANLLASRTAQLALLQWKTGGLFSIENPESSYLWLYKPIARLFALVGVKLYTGDQCRYMCQYVQPTGWLSNATFFEILEKRCPGPQQHVHSPLMGFTTDFEGQRVFRTSLAAEYPQGLCIELARAYSSYLNEHPSRPSSWELRMKEGDRQELFGSKKYIVERENDDCIGGLRNPVRAMSKLPGWRDVGRLLWQCLDRSGFSQSSRTFGSIWVTTLTVRTSVWSFLWLQPT